MLHRFAIFVVGCTVLLLLAGSLVTSTESGLSVPDWPTTYGWNMFTFPPSMWVGGIFYEHGHRLIASAVGLLTIVLAVWIWLRDPRGWMRWLGLASVATVVAQGLLGGLTVLFFLPPAVSTAHAGLAEIFFCLTVAIALFSSPRWIAGYEELGPRDAPADLTPATKDGGEAKTSRTLRRLATMTTALIYIQILIGAAVRHGDAGLAIPDFPLMFGGPVPDRWDPGIAVHFAHRVGALLVAIAIAVTAGHVWLHAPRRRELTRPVALLLGLVAVQVTLGALTVLSQRQVWINSLHVVCGALVLTTSLVLTLRTWRDRLATPGVRRKPDATYRQHGRPSTSAVRSVRLPPDVHIGLQSDRGVP